MTQISEKSIIHKENAKEFIENYWTKRASGFKNLRREELQSDKQQQWQEEICRHLPSGRKLKILDIGCGAGFFSILLGAKGHEVTGIDLTESMIEAAAALAAEKNSSACFRVMDAESLTFPAETFDAVVSRNVTWNLPHPEQAYAEWLRVLKPGGLLLNYDAEYGRYHQHDYEKEAIYAHKDVTKEMVAQCHQIYHMLDISLCQRPQWDLEVLQKLGASTCSADTTVGLRLYPQKDKFYAPAPLFGIIAVK
ncbi:MAG: class I SAM-dependent methyltransferase [Acidaminococcaceae bacterium]|nr:class I SAM-dependent methyltransferase [Acidaminococcaceae bacterium]